MRSYQHLSRQGGFTLIEVMVVVVILGILAAVAVPRIMDNPDKARVAKARQDVRAIEAALDMYRLDNYNYPSTQQGLEALVRQPSGEPSAPNWKDGGYLRAVPKDPWGNDYLFLSPGSKSDIDVYSLGADDRPGGDGVASDIGNWQTGG